MSAGKHGGHLDAHALFHLGAIHVAGDDADRSDTTGLANHQFATSGADQVAATVGHEVDDAGDGFLLGHGPNVSSQLERTDGRTAWAVDIQHDALDHRIRNSVANLPPQRFIAGHRLAHADVTTAADQHAANRNHLDAGARDCRPTLFFTLSDSVHAVVRP
ncbi:hypothetical protein D3C84_802340 [compost metagenome]